MSKYFITTPIYYVNDVPHIGSAYTTLVADVLARAHAQQGDEILFLTGTDEHGAKIAQKAAAEGMEPQQYADKISAEFQKTWAALGVEPTTFARTTDKEHERIVGQCMQELYGKKLIYPGEYEGWYCVGCEEYKDIEGENPICDVHNKPLELIKEKIYYFALSQYQDRLIEVIESGEFTVNPVERKNEVLAFLKGQPLRDIPVTRSKVAWGIPVPFDPEQTVYVWVDALLYYLSFSLPKSDSSANMSQQTWSPTTIQLLGKDILRFHAVIWPAMLMALEQPLPKEIFVHGFFTINGTKMSKTLGNVIAPHEVVERYGTDAARYLIISAVPLGADGDMSFEKMDAAYSSQLSNGLGNLLQRTIVLINKFGIKPQVTPTDNTEIDKAYQANDLTKALELTFQLVDDANRYLAAEQPWAMDNDALRETVLVKTYEQLQKIATALEPVMPSTATKMKSQLENLQPEPLFPRLG